nr:hypothetical protein [Clavibacter michiganensis]
MPLTIIASFPARNWSRMSCWLALTLALDACPSFTMSVQRVSARTAAGEEMSDRSAPAPQKNGRNWNVPSSVPIAEKPRPCTSPCVVFAAASSRLAQSVGGWTPAAASLALS